MLEGLYLLMNAQGQSKRIGQYLIEKTLGQGTFGKVKLGIHQPTGQRVAVKVLEKKKIVDVSDIERVSREIHILKLVRHPNLIQLYEIIETPKYLFLVMEYCGGGELFDYIADQKKLTERQACRFFHQIIDGVDYLHRLGIVHRDLKPQNMLLDSARNIKIVDFGLSNTYAQLPKRPAILVQVEQSQETEREGQTERETERGTEEGGNEQKEELKTACGSPCYAAPEMIAGKKYNGLQVDLWSCGVILYAMICGTLPFEDPNTSLLYKKILTLNYKIPNDISTFAKDMLKGLLTTSAKRIGLTEIRAHQFYRLHNHPPAQGILVGRHAIPVDNNIIAEIARLGYDSGFAQQCLMTNKHNAATTAYYLLLKQRHQAGFQSIADINSNRFDTTLLGNLRLHNSTSRTQPHSRGRSSVDRLLDAQRQTEFGEVLDKRKSSVGRVSRYVHLREGEGKNRSKVGSRLQQSFDSVYKSKSKERELKDRESVDLTDRTDRTDRESRLGPILNLPTLNRKNHRKIFMNLKS